MNIKIPYSWVKNYLDTKAEPEEVFRLLTKIGPTVERVEKVKDDYLLDIEVTINRPDCLSVIGIAREAFVALKQDGVSSHLVNDVLLDPPKIVIPNKLPDLPFNFNIDAQLCPRFMAIKLTGIKIGPSPDFIVDRLKKAGMRSLNNVIDITNYVMLETGQPNHAFDFCKINGPRFAIRAAKKGETLITLDDQKRQLEPGDIVYEDEDKIFDLTGIMGGKPSEIDDSTTEVLFTVVNNYFAQIRKTSMRLGLNTEASSRLSKILNPEVVMPTFYRGVELLVKYAGAEISSRIFDHYPNPRHLSPIKLQNQQVSRLAGITIQTKEIDSILTNLGLRVKRNNSEIQVTPPIWRINDIQIAEDVIEEITRVYGYDKIPNQSPVFDLPTVDKKSRRKFIVENRLRKLLVDSGYTEAMSYSMLNKNDFAALNAPVNDHLTISNPLSEDWLYLQTSLLPNALKNIARNTNSDCHFFEIANTFTTQKGENNTLAVYQNTGDFYQLKGVLDKIFAFFHLDEVDYSSGDVHDYYGQQSSAIVVNQRQIGSVGIAHPDITNSYNLACQVYFFEIDLSDFVELSDKDVQFKPLLPYQPIIEDLSLIVPTHVTYQQIHQLIIKTPNVSYCSLIDRFENRFTFRINYQLKDRQISATESAHTREELLRELDCQLGVKLRTD